MVYTVNEIKGKVEPIFAEKGVLRAVLFGSYAKGEATPESDVDILAYVDDGMDILDFAEMSGEVEDVLLKKVDFIYGGDILSDGMTKQINETGVVLFEKV